MISCLIIFVTYMKYLLNFIFKIKFKEKGRQNKLKITIYFHLI